MTDRERAIRSCENKIRQYEKRLSGADFHRGATMNSIEIERIKIAALRAEADREKGCEYCNNESHIRNKVDTLEFADGTIRDDKGLTVSIATTVKNNKPMVFVDICNYENDLQFGFAANFCPMCGAKMSGGADNGTA